MLAVERHGWIRVRHARELFAAIQEKRQLIPRVDQVWRFVEGLPSEKFDGEIGGLELGTIEFDAEVRDQFCELVIVGIVEMVQLRIVVHVSRKDRAKGLDVSDVKQRLRNGAPQVAVECLQDKVIGTQRGRHSGRPVQTRQRNLNYGRSNANCSSLSWARLIRD
ncbi:hypothetical protein [Rhodoplanes sp. Z2-YC6860]|uniref:hypothetical protein n=1 Tax=Rhodoplanes sp. Z2-YC6860 TaxID=674703 RepID=UPI001AECBF85|nr:hypothetical protein [Rhodoplanes sp. Z2-YC6860]